MKCNKFLHTETPFVSHKWLGVILLMLMFVPGMAQAQEFSEVVDSISALGFEMFEEEIDDAIFRTNEFLTDSTFIGASGPFWWILEMCMALGAMFAIIMAAGMAYKMMVKGEPFDVLKILRVLGIAVVMFWWYPRGDSGASFLGMLAYVPNCIGSYTHDLYEIEAAQVQEKLKDLHPKINERDSLLRKSMAEYETAKNGLEQTGSTVGESVSDLSAQMEGEKKANEAWYSSTYAGVIVCVDKLVMLASLMLFRIGWWGTIYCQQILLGMLTIFGPIMWAFSILPKWEGAWAKWISRYLTVHFYGAMLYFVGFYVLLLWDIVLSVQYENLCAIMESPEAFQGYLKSTFVTSAYLLVAGIISMKCLSLVPDLAAWMIPEGETSFSTRSFGEGVASSAKMETQRFLK